MENLKKSLQEHKENRNDIAWIMAVSAIHHTYSNALESSKDKLAQFSSRRMFQNEEAGELKELGEQLVESQQKIVPQLALMNEKNKKMGALYFQLDELKKEKDDLLNQLAAEKEDYKDQLASELSMLKQ